MPAPAPFLPHGGSYKNLIAYQKAECVYDVTFCFVHHFLEKGDRTIDQMVQAAHNDSAFYRNTMPDRSAETIANIAITLIHQTDWLLGKLIKKLEIKFVESGA